MYKATKDKPLATTITGSLPRPLTPRAGFGDAPLFTDLVKDKVTDPLAREAVTYWTNLIRVGDWLALVPGTPAPIVAAYRRAFHQIVNDPQFAGSIKTAFPEVVEMTGGDLAKLAGDLAHTPPPTLAYLSRLRDSLRR